MNCIRIRNQINKIIMKKIFFLIFGFDTELGKLIFSYILLITMIPFTGFGINVYAVFIIPVIGIVLFILSRKELKKLN